MVHVWFCTSWYNKITTNNCRVKGITVSIGNAMVKHGFFITLISLDDIFELLEIYIESTLDVVLVMRILFSYHVLQLAFGHW